MTQTELDLERDGVVLCQGIVPTSSMDVVREQYDQIDKVLTRTEIQKDRPIIVFWTHVPGQQKRLSNFDEFPALDDLIRDVVVPNLRRLLPSRTGRLQLLETIIFQKPPHISNTLNWHQDVAYFPMKPNNQIAVWIPFDFVDMSRSAMVYALGSHKAGAMGSIDLHTRVPFQGEDRPLIPADPASEGWNVKCMEMGPEDMLLHDGYTWHYTGPNVVDGYTRKGLSIRFITDEARFDPRPGQGAAFTKQIDLKPGDVIQGAAFPLV